MCFKTLPIWVNVTKEAQFYQGNVPLRHLQNEETLIIF